MGNASAGTYIPGRPIVRAPKAARRALASAGLAILGALAAFAPDASHAQGGTPLAGATQVTAGDRHACALLSTGGVKCWGNNDFGKLGDGTTTPSSFAVDVQGVANAVDVATGSDYGCAVTDTGGVKCWGLEPQFTAGSGSASEVRGLYDVSGLDGMTAHKVAAGTLHACAIVDTATDNGAVYCWGDNDYGQLGNGTPSSSEILPVRAGVLTDATAIAAGGAHTCAIAGAGVVKCWGSGELGQLGDGVGGSGVLSATPVDVPLGSPATSIAAGGNHTCALLASGEVACWGWNYYGQLGTLPLGPDTYLAPAIVAGATGATAIGAGGSGSCAVIGDGTVRCWGSSNFNPSGAEVPTTVPGLTNAASVAVGDEHRCALVGDGVQCWGDNEWGQLGNGYTNSASSPVDVVGIANAVDIAAGGSHTCAALALPGGVEPVKCWGANNVGQLGDGSTSASSVPVGVYDFGATQVAAGDSHTCALRNNGNVACWGNNIWGQLGHPPSNDVPGLLDPKKPVDVPFTSGAIQVVAGVGHSCALMGDKTVKCWGYNRSGQLGLGDTLNRDTPVVVPGLAGVDEIAAGMAHTCARIGGSVKCWGANFSGQLGNGGQMDVNPSPLDVSGLTDAAQITAGSYHTCARLGDGNARCWGGMALGNGAVTSSKVPVAVSLSGILQITAGGGHTCARVSGDTVKCWGYNGSGQLGNDGAVGDSELPVDVVGLAGVAKLSAGRTHTCAITSGLGVVKCWGSGKQGELGNGQTGIDGQPAAVLLASPRAMTTTSLSANPGASAYGQSVTLTATVFNGNAPSGVVAFSANGSPVAGCESIALAGNQAQCVVSTLPSGTNALAATYGGDAANLGSTGTLSYDVGKMIVSLAITGHTPDPSQAFAPVAVTVALALVPPGSGTPTGTILVSGGGATCTITLPGTSCALAPGVVGAIAIHAQYGGDAWFESSAAPAVPHTTTALLQTITFPSLPDLALGNAPFIVSATASSGLTVAFASMTPAICTVSGNTVTLVAAGLCTITADQAGDATYAPAPQAIRSFSVGRTNATLALSSSANPSTSGQAVTFTLGASGIVGTPTGTVTFSDGGTPLCSSVALDAGGSASCTTSALAGGAHAIAADYSGDATKYLPGTATLGQSVTVAGPPAAYAIADVDYPAASETEVRALTDNGQLVGLATLAGVPTPFAYAAGAYAPLPGGSGYAEVSPWGIAGGGAIVGGASDSSASPTAGSGFTLTGSTYSLLARFGWPVTEVRGVNAAGTLVGYAFDPATSTSVAFLYDPATTTYTDIAIAAPGWRKIAHAINTAGQVVGSVDDGTTAQGFLREANGTVTPFQVSGLPTYARGINDAGVIAGYVISGGVAQGFVGNAASGYEMLVVPGAVETVAQAINNAGQVAGYWVDGSGRRHGFIATPGQLPVGTTTAGGFRFDVAVVGGQPVFIDPAVAVGYDYAVGAGDPLFVAVRLPIGFGDNQYTVTANGVAMVVAGGEMHDLRAHNAPAGVAAFRVTGIETSAYVDPDDPRGFPTEVTFAASGRFTGTQTPIVVDAPWLSAMTLSATPNPARAGQWIAYTATVTSPGGTPTGSVAFSEGRRTLCTAVLSAGVAQCSGPPLSIGDHAVVARYAGNAEYAAATQTLTVSVRTPGGKSAQTITFAPLPDRTTGDPPFTVSATASSGLPVAFTSATPFVCKVNGNVVTLTRVGGVCLVIAMQGGNASYLPALPAPRAFLVRRNRG